jgi:hypothetical protein
MKGVQPFAHCYTSKYPSIFRRVFLFFVSLQAIMQVRATEAVLLIAGAAISQSLTNKQKNKQ